MKDLLLKIIKLQEQHPTLYLGGSISLILQKAIPYRVPGDIDIICREKINPYLILEGKTKPYIRRRKILSEGYEWEFFINPDAQFIEMKTNIGLLRLSPIYEIYEWKYKHTKFNKHLNDIMIYENVNQK